MEQKNLTRVRLEPDPEDLPLCYRSHLRKLAFFWVFKGNDMILLRKNTDGANYYLQQTICFLLQQQQLLNGTINVTWVRLEPGPTALGACTLPLCYRSLLRKLAVFGVFWVE